MGPEELLASISAQTNVNCSGNATGTATVGVTGGTTGYNYSWNTSPVQTTATATALAAGDYIVTVTDAHGCSTTASVTISEPTVLNATASEGSIACHGGQTTVTITATGTVQLHIRVMVHIQYQQGHTASL